MTNKPNDNPFSETDGLDETSKDHPRVKIDESQFYAEEDGWQPGNPNPIMDLRSNLIVLIILVPLIVIITLIIAIPKIMKARMDANQMAAKTACSECMTAVATAQTQLGDPPTYHQLKDFLDPTLWSQMAQHPADTDSIGHSVNVGVDYTGDLTNSTGYKSYAFSYLCNFSNNIAPDDPTSATPIDPQVRAVEALPKRYNKGGKNAYYRASETASTYQPDYKNLNPVIANGDKCTFFPSLLYNFGHVPNEDDGR